MKDEEQDYLYALTGDKDSEQRLTDFVFYYGLRLAVRERWKVNSSAIIEKMSAAAVQEILHERCHACDGTGLDRKHRPCARCSGSGVRRLPDRVLSEKIGIDPRLFALRWRRRYDCLYVAVEDIRSNVRASGRQGRYSGAVLLA